MDDSGRIRRAPPGIEIVNRRSLENRTAGCYAAAIGGCGPRLTAEHYFSHVLLRRLTREGGQLRIGKTVWLPKGESRDVAPATLTAKVLCDAHNSTLSPYDVVGDRFCGLLMRSGYETARPRTEIGLFNGEDVERWLLKTLCGVASMEAAVRRTSWVPPIAWLDLLFKRTRSEWPGFGLFLSLQAFEMFPDGLSLAATPVDDPKGGDPLALRFHFCGLEFVLMTGETGRSALLPMPRFRPGLLAIDYPGSISVRLAIRYNHTPPGVTLRIGPPSALSR